MVSAAVVDLGREQHLVWGGGGREGGGVGEEEWGWKESATVSCLLLLPS